MALPYIASKMNPFIDLLSCTFNNQDYDKAKTARVILGNLIKDTGTVFTFEISLFGGSKGVKMLLFRAKKCLFWWNTTSSWPELSLHH